jgi:L-lactate dehydrogenase complex protein LldG
MSTDIVAQFEASVRDVADGCSRTDPSGFETALSEHVRRPAVGTELPFEGVSLDGSAVTVDPSVRALEAARTGVTPAGLGIADHGTVTVRSRAGADELVSLYPRRHVAVIAASDVVPDVSAAFEHFENDTGSRVLATGPSLTDDIGSPLEGVHGPESVHVIVLET